MDYANYINKQGLLKIVSISISQHLFLLTFFERFFSCNEISEEENIHIYNWEFFLSKSDLIMSSNEKKYMNEKSIRIESTRMKSIQTGNSIEWKTTFNVFLAKRNGKCILPNKKVVLLDSKCTWSNVNLVYGIVTILHQPK